MTAVIAQPKQYTILNTKIVMYFPQKLKKRRRRRRRRRERKEGEEKKKKK